ncbi:MAG: MFS transporter [Roseiflexus sp.]|jgi:UMF1 family MFS transporter|nr:MFS transporter [Roseiflexus sp.]MBO9335238.1 MFS transporter [Roseiflexus sp.]MBO9365744.1 MFS transporter [Roseiflexus sp.]MBO9382450.1 MFS transporter [Roseiflexus sp.]MBO9390701.1 MFS transporter [Roseiflexus sp.]
MSAEIARSAGAAAIDDRREQTGWYFYDWANSAFSTTVVTVFLGPYLTAVTRRAADADGFVYPLGIPVAAGAFFPYMVSLSVLLQVLFLPILGAIADYTHLKKHLLGVFAYAGAIATMLLYFLDGGNYLFGGILFLIANLSFGASIVFYNAFLPEIASPDRRDAVSSQGWALGYLGGGLLLVANLLLFQNAEAFGVSSEHAVRISITSAGMWWAIFTIIPLLTLRRRDPIKRIPPGEHYVTIGFKQLWETLRKARNYPQTLLFLGAYLLYNDGIQTVIALASQFGAEELKLEQSTLISAILMVQFVAFVGALAFGRVAEWLGATRAILVSLVIWTSVIIAAYGWVQPGNPTQFYLLAAAIAIVLGGSQAISRSLFSQMIPLGQESEYFSLYEVSERGTSWLGPLVFGLALQFTGSYRVAILLLMVFFIAGMALLLRVDARRAILEAGNVPPAKV